MGRHRFRAATARAFGETGWRETGHGSRGMWTVDHGPRHLSACLALIGG